MRRKAILVGQWLLALYCQVRPLQKATGAFCQAENGYDLRMGQLQKRRRLRLEVIFLFFFLANKQAAFVKLSFLKSAFYSETHLERVATLQPRNL
jgi:hypothetical protein